MTILNTMWVRKKVTCNVYELLASDIFDNDPTTPPSDHSNPHNPLPHLPWINSNSKVTLFLPNKMKVPKQGYFNHNKNSWEFLLEHNHSNPPITLPNFLEVAESLVHNRKLFQGWKSKAVVLTACQSCVTSNTIAHNIYNRHVLANKLHLL